MDAASDILCWANNTLSWEISNVKPPCWNGTVVQYKEFVTSDISILINSIDTNTIHYIASQHFIECFPDTLQNILMFADGFREIYAPFAKKLFKEHPKDLLYSTSDINATDRITKLIRAHYNNAELDDQLLKFLAGTFRRYILIKLAEKNISEKEIEKYINAILPSSWTKDKLIKSVVPPRLGRAPSINGLAGPYLKLTTEQCFESKMGYKLDSAVAQDMFVDKMFPLLFIKHNITIETKYHNIKNGSKELVAIQTGFFNTISRSAHVLGIIRNNGKYYIIDNEAGIAKEITNMDKFDGNNFLYGQAKGSTIYRFGNEDIIKNPNNSTNADINIWYRTFIRYFYIDNAVV